MHQIKETQEATGKKKIRALKWHFLQFQGNMHCRHSVKPHPLCCLRAGNTRRSLPVFPASSTPASSQNHPSESSTMRPLDPNIQATLSTECSHQKTMRALIVQWTQRKKMFALLMYLRRVALNYFCTEYLKYISKRSNVHHAHIVKQFRVQYVLVNEFLYCRFNTKSPLKSLNYFFK